MLKSSINNKFKVEKARERRVSHSQILVPRLSIKRMLYLLINLKSLRR
jgi:hypothetical protein